MINTIDELIEEVNKVKNQLLEDALEKNKIEDNFGEKTIEQIAKDINTREMSYEEMYEAQQWIKDLKNWCDSFCQEDIKYLKEMEEIAEEREDN